MWIVLRISALHMHLSLPHATKWLSTQAIQSPGPAVQRMSRVDFNKWRLNKVLPCKLRTSNTSHEI